MRTCSNKAPIKVIVSFLLLVILTTRNSVYALKEYRGANARIVVTEKTQTSSITSTRICIKNSFYPEAKLPFLNHLPLHNYNDSPRFDDIEGVLGLRGGSSYSNDNGGGGYYGNHRDYNDNYEVNDPYAAPASGRGYDDSSYYSRGRNEEDDYYPEDDRYRDNYNDDDARYNDRDDYYDAPRSSSVSPLHSKFLSVSF